MQLLLRAMRPCASHWQHFRLDPLSILAYVLMGKNKGQANIGKAIKHTSGNSKPNDASSIQFPFIGNKKGPPRTLEAPKVLAPDQILLYENVLTSKECDELVSMFSPSSEASLSMQASPPAKKGEAERTNSRFSTVSPSFASQLYTSTGLSSVVKAWPSMFTNTSLKPKALSSNIRVYRYDPGDIFACHYDDHSTDPFYGPDYGKTEWTLLIYLTGEPDVEGGQTVFYKSHVRPKKGMADQDKAIVVPLVKGGAVLHRHGKVSVNW